MDWSRFDHRGENPSAAFEALTVQLFERFCRREYGGALREVRAVEGKGGDGGVEAYAILTSGDEVGLQAKWFREAFGDKQLEQIGESLETARANHPRLVRYIVALPRNLGDVNDKRASTGPKKQRPRQSERERWEAWKGRALSSSPPGFVLELWDESKLEGLLAEPENEGLAAYWFTDREVRLDHLKEHFAAAKHGWLKLRYRPDLHAVAELEKDLSLHLGEPEARAELLGEVLVALGGLREVRDDIARLANYPSFTKAIEDAQALRAEALDAVEKHIAAGEALAQALRTGARRDKPQTSNRERAESSPLLRLTAALEELERNAPLHRAATHDTLQRLNAVISAPVSTLGTLLNTRERWARSVRSIAFIGDPGTGKTHGLTHAVEARLAHDLPALLLRARDCPVDQGWSGILRWALDRPSLKLEEALNALDVLAVRADVRRAREGAATEGDMLDGKVAAEPTCFLLAIDGLEESGRHERWAELLGELSVHLEKHPRLRVAVTLRSSSEDTILRQMNAAWFDRRLLVQRQHDVQALLKSYCKAYDVPLPDRRLRWAIRDALSVRLYCDLQGNVRGSRAALSLPGLLGAKLEHEEAAMRQREGKERWSQHEHPLRAALTTLAKLYVDRGPVPRGEALTIVGDTFSPRGRFTAAEWSAIFEEAEQAGLLLVEAKPANDLLSSEEPYVEPAYDPLTDYLIAAAACAGIPEALARGEQPRLNDLLQRRPDALTQAAILLAQKGVSLIASGLWQEQLSLAERETLQLLSIAALDAKAALPYADWVRGRLTASMPSCRKVLAYLCVPLARDEGHPFGPRFVHEALLPFLPAQRDLFWSGPGDLPGDGVQPWEGRGPQALEAIKLVEDDRDDGPPLLLAWALTSVDERWRRRLRIELAQWGARQLDELMAWFDLAMQTNDPQMAEDVAMVAYGAACLAGVDPKLGALAAWADANLLAPGAPHRREDLVVLHAARGIVERARVMGAEVTSRALEHARKLYTRSPEALPIDAAAAKEADDHWGVTPITGDLAWYVVPGAIKTFFVEKPTAGASALDPRAARVLSLHAESSHLMSLTPQKLAFGIIAAHLHAMGWNTGTSQAMDRAVCGRYEQETHGSRSPVCTLAEKYVWTGCSLIQAYLAGHLPLDAYDGQDRWTSSPYLGVEPPVDPVLVSGEIPPNPASDSLGVDAQQRIGWAYRPDDELIPNLKLGARSQLAMAEEWVRTAPKPELRPWLLLSGHAAPSWSTESEWLVLRAFSIDPEQASQADSVLRVAAFILPATDQAALRRDAIMWDPERYHDFSQFSEGVRCHTYADPFDACWAPWAKGVSGVDHLELDSSSSSGRRIDLRAASASMHWEDGRGESTMLLPARWLREALDLVDIERRQGDDGEEWRFTGRSGEVLAVFVRTQARKAKSEAVLVRRSALQEALAARGEVLAWSAWLFREPDPSLLQSKEADALWPSHDFEWLAFLTSKGVEIFEPPASIGNTDTIAPPQETRKPKQATPPPLVPIGPTNPGLAVNLTTELDDDNAIPYFLWDDPMTVAEVRHYLRTASPPEQNRLLGKILREARDPDVWRFTTPQEVDARFDALARHLGRRRKFWEFLLGCWRKEGLLGPKSA